MTQMSISQSPLCCELEQVASKRRSLISLLRHYWQRHQSRQTLHYMSDHQLRDLGLTRDQVIREAIKPFWR